MELMNPIAIGICFILGIAIFVINFKKKKKYINGKKVANTKYIKETEYYKEKVKKYKILSYIIKGLCVACIVACSILIARPVTVQVKSEDKYNRDILLGIDMSTSENEVNLELLKKFKNILPDIQGDRIGIVLYNTAPVVYCPLTDDYNYINECIDKILEQIENEIKVETQAMYQPEPYYEYYTFWYGGMVTGNQKKGSSLVGDGLARYYIFIP